MKRFDQRNVLAYLLPIFLFFVMVKFMIVPVAAQEQIEIWWPQDYRTLSGVQPFKGLLQNTSIGNYDMYWQVDTGQQVRMYDSLVDHPHKEAIVDFSGWTWKGSGPYILTFTAKSKTNEVLSTRKITICVKNNCLSSTPTPVTTNIPSPTAPNTPTPTPTRAPTPTATPTPTQTANTLKGLTFYVDPDSNAKKQYALWRYTQPQNASYILKIAEAPTARWFGGWNKDIKTEVNAFVTAATKSYAVPLLVAYNIPLRDCGGYSAGGTISPDAYKSWIGAFAAGINNRRAIVILEPDAVANITCLTPVDQNTRYGLLSYAVDALKAKGALVYVDAGHSNWIASSEMAARLKKAGVEKATGFSLNVSNFITTQKNVDYGNTVSKLVSGKHFVIDTSRNGLGTSPDGQWCNPAGRALGSRPTTATGNPLVDAFLWIKYPGESDGACNGGPSAGVWWPEYALGLAQRAAY